MFSTEIFSKIPDRLLSKNQKILDILGIEESDFDDWDTYIKSKKDHIRRFFKDSLKDPHYPMFGAPTSMVGTGNLHTGDYEISGDIRYDGNFLELSIILSVLVREYKVRDGEIDPSVYFNDIKLLQLLLIVFALESYIDFIFDKKIFSTPGSLGKDFGGIKYNGVNQEECKKSLENKYKKKKISVYITRIRGIFHIALGRELQDSELEEFKKLFGFRNELVHKNIDFFSKSGSLKNDLV